MHKPTPPEDTPVEAMHYRTFKMTDPDDEDVASCSRETLGVEGERALTSREHYPLRWGNEGGLSTLEKLDGALEELRELGPKVKVLEAQLATIQEQLATTQEQLAITQDEMQNVKMLSAGYLQVRSRFISTFRRDVLHDTDIFDRRTIMEGNIVAHSGDAVLDALLYRDHVRTDFRIYIKLYGMTWGEVLAHTADKTTLRVLDQYATAKAKSDVPLTPDVEDTFRKFCDLLQDSGWDEHYPNDPQSPVNTAYWRFLNAFNAFKAAHPS